MPEFSLAEAELAVEQASAVATLCGGKGQGYHIGGKPVRRDPNSQRLSCLEPEIYTALNSAQKKEQIALANQHKKSLDSLILQLKDQVVTMRGLIAFETFKGHSSSVAIPNIHSLKFDSNYQTKKVRVVKQRSHVFLNLVV